MSFSEVLTKFFPKEEDKKLHSKEIAKERLRLVLVQDRGNSLPEDMLLQIWPLTKARGKSPWWPAFRWCVSKGNER